MFSFVLGEHICGVRKGFVSYCHCACLRGPASSAFPAAIRLHCYRTPMNLDVVFDLVYILRDRYSVRSDASCATDCV